MGAMCNPRPMCAGPQLEVLDAIIGPDAVLVMDCLAGEEIASQMGLHYKTVLTDAAVVIRKRMVGAIDNDVALRVEVSASAPVGGACAGVRTSVMAGDMPQWLTLNPSPGSLSSLRERSLPATATCAQAHYHVHHNKGEVDE